MTPTGYRLCIDDTGHSDLNYYDTKLFGYFDEKGFRSYQYLCGIGKANDDMTWDYDCENRMELTPEEFAVFIDLYEQDHEEAYHNAPGWNMKTDTEYWKIDELKKTNRNKLIYWM